MSRILLIENDAAFAAELARALQATGYDTIVASEGREGLALAASSRPDGIVLCVELPDTSGYLICQRLRKDEALRAIPLVLTSADATEKSFADHQKLKVRADEYLLKPYTPGALLELLGRRVGLPEGAAEEEELIRLEDGAAAEEASLPALDLEVFGDEATPAGPAPLAEDAAPPQAPASDDELLLDALDGLGRAPAPAHQDEPGPGDLGGGLELDLDGELDRPVGADDLDAAAASLPDEGPDRSPFAREPGDDAALDALDGDGGLPDLAADDGLDELGGSEEPPSSPQPSALDLDLEEDKTRDRPIRGASADLLRAAGIKLLDEDDPEPDGDALTVPTMKTLTPPPRTRMAGAGLDVEPDPGEDLEGAGPGEAFAAVRTSSPDGVQAERMERELAEARASLSDARSDLLSRDSELRAAKDKISALTRRAEEAEAEVRQAREQAGETAELEERLAAAERRAEDAARARAETEKRAAEADRRAVEAEKRAAEAANRAEAAQAEARRRGDEDAHALQRADAMQRELEKAEAQLASTVTQLTALKAQASEKSNTALERRIAELEAAAAKNEERVLKAYQKIRGDEKVRDKVRKALSIASQLLDEGMAPDPGGDRPRPAVPPLDPKS